MSNNIDLVEIKLYEDKMNIVNFPHLIKGESHTINFSITRLVKNYGENSAQVGIDWNIVKPTSSVLLIRKANSKALYKIYNSKNYSNTTTFEVSSAFLNEPGETEFQLKFYIKGGAIDKTPIWKATIADSLEEGDAEVPNKEDIDKYIDSKLTDLYAQINNLKTVVQSLLERIRQLEEYHNGEEDPDNPTTTYMYYGRLSFNEVGETITPYGQITESKIKNGVNMTKAETGRLIKTSLGKESQCNEGDYVVVAVPVSSNYTVTQDNGIGGKAPFNEDISGANGQYRLSINGVQYKLFGEIMPAAGEYFIYID